MREHAPGHISPWVAFCAGVVATLMLVLALWAVGAIRQVREVRLTATVPVFRDLQRLPDLPMPRPR